MTRILVLEIKDRYKLELQSSETMTVFGSTKKLADKTKNGVAEVILVRYNLVDNQYQQQSDVLYTFTPNKSYAKLLNLEPSNLVLFKTYNTEFGEIIITITD